MKRLLHTLVILALPLTVPAQSLELRNGKVLIGTVVEANADGVALRVGDAEAEHYTRDAIAPLSLYSIVSARSDANSATAHWKLGELCIDLELPSHAIAEFETAARIDPAMQRLATEHIARVRGHVADKIVEKGEQDYAANRYATAKLNAEVVLDEYSDTRAVQRARRLLANARMSLMAGPERKSVDEKTLRRALDKAHKSEHKANELGVTLTGGFRFTAKEKNKRATAARHLESAWKRLSRIAPADGTAAQLVDEYTSSRERVRDLLGKHYLGLGAVHVQRLALPSAEDYNARACALDPDSGGCKQLQSLIIQARISSGFGI